MIGKISDLFGKYFSKESSANELNLEYWCLKKSFAKRFGIDVEEVEVSKFNSKDGMFGTVTIGLDNSYSVKSVPMNAYNFIMDIEGNDESYLVQANLEYKILDVCRFERLRNRNKKTLEYLE